MRLILIVFFSLLCAINLPVISILTSKRIGFLGLVIILISDIIVRRRLYFTGKALAVVIFWFLFIVSSLIGLISSNEINSTVLAIGFTFCIVILLKLIIDSTNDINLDHFYKGWYMATFMLSILFLYQIFSLVKFDVLNVLFLRKILLEASFSINSTFNQIVILIFCNVFILFNANFSKFKRYASLFFASILFFFIVFSLSRQNLLACLIMFSFIFYKFTSSKLKLYCFLIVFPFLMVFVSTKINVDNLASITARIDKTISQVTSGDYTRFKQFSDSFVAGTESPVFGIGLGNYYSHAKSLGYSEHVRVPEAAVNQVIAEHGLIMLILFLSTLIIMYYSIRASGGITKLQPEIDLFKSAFVAFFVLLLFNEIHVQTSIWVLYLLFIFLKSHYSRTTF